MRKSNKVALESQFQVSKSVAAYLVPRQDLWQALRELSQALVQTSVHLVL